MKERASGDTDFSPSKKKKTGEKPWTLSLCLCRTLNPFAGNLVTYTVEGSFCGVGLDSDAWF